MGFGSTLRVIAFAYLCLLIIPLLTIRSRLTHTHSKVKISGFMIPLTEWCVVVLSLAGFFLFLGIFLPYDFLVVEALAGGISRTSANNLLVILNATGFALLGHPEELRS